MMGSPPAEKDRRDDESQHEVEITKGFYLGIHEVTIGQFRRFVELENYRTEAERDGKGGYGYDVATIAVNIRRQRHNERTPRRFPSAGFIKSGDDLLSRYSHYHGPQVLNGRVRNGNGCGHLGMVTGKLSQG